MRCLHGEPPRRSDAAGADRASRSVRRSGGSTACPDAVEAALGARSRRRPPPRLLELIGAGPNQWTAAEGALKIRETSRIATEGLAVEQFLHGPSVAVGERDALVCLDGGGPGQERLLAVAARRRRSAAARPRAVRDCPPRAALDLCADGARATDRARAGGAGRGRTRTCSATTFRAARKSGPLDSLTKPDDQVRGLVDLERLAGVVERRRRVVLDHRRPTHLQADRHLGTAMEPSRAD